MESDSSGLMAHPTTPVQCPPAVDPLPAEPAELGSNIPDSEFNDDVLDILVPDLVPNLSKLELLDYKIQH